MPESLPRRCTCRLHLSSHILVKVPRTGAFVVVCSLVAAATKIFWWAALAMAPQGP